MDEYLAKLIVVPEDNMHDFKREWYGKREKAELARDILSFINTSHHKDCYIFIGISDSLEVVGVNQSDPNRKNQSDLLDLIRHWPTADYIIPEISLFEIEVESKIIDVMKIHNTNNVPVFFDNIYPNKISKDKRKKEWQIRPNQIFTRTGDVNTPRDSSADYNLIKDLWRKNFQLDLSIYQQYESRLKDVSNWNYIENEDTTGFIYKLDPDYFILIEDDNVDRNQVEAYSIDVIDCRIGWDILKLKYRHLTIDNYMITYLDGARGMIVPPNMGIIKVGNSSDDTYSYYKYIENDFRYYLNQMIQTAFNINAEFKYTLNNLVLPNIVVYKNKTEQENIEQLMIVQIRENMEHIASSEEEVSRTQGKVIQSITDKRQATEYAIKYMLTQKNIARYINEYKNNE